MAGIYIHIPFCKQACSYCDFHFSTQLQYKENFLNALIKEIHLTKDYLVAEPIETIYFGGGTPSLLNIIEINRIISTIKQYYSLASLKEVTLEANPDDLNPSYLYSLKNETIINRLSIGIQSFQEHDLSLMNRAHNASQAQTALNNSIEAGFNNISCDLIFGTPTLTDEELIENIKLLAAYNIAHISAYSLTIEDRTALAHQVKKGTFRPSSEETYSRQMLLTMEQLSLHGYEQYEISNYARYEQYALHNTNYWRQKKYLGLGPSAHSFNGNSRKWNIANNALYIKGLHEDILHFESEDLTVKDQVNEYIMTGLRTKWGLDKAYLLQQFGENIFNTILLHAQEFIITQHIVETKSAIQLTPLGRLIADHICSELFID